jgi:hypothetical protein
MGAFIRPDATNDSTAFTIVSFLSFSSTSSSSSPALFLCSTISLAAPAMAQ